MNDNLKRIQELESRLENALNDVIDLKEKVLEKKEDTTLSRKVLSKLKAFLDDGIVKNADQVMSEFAKLISFEDDNAVLSHPDDRRYKPPSKNEFINAKSFSDGGIVPNGNDDRRYSVPDKPLVTSDGRCLDILTDESTDYHTPFPDGRFCESFKDSKGTQLIHHIINQGNMFVDEKSCLKYNERRAMKLKVLAVIAQHNRDRGWVVDWGDRQQDKRYFCCRRVTDKHETVIYRSVNHTRVLPDDYYFHEDDAKSIISELGEDFIMKALWGIEKNEH